MHYFSLYTLRLSRAKNLRFTLLSSLLLAWAIFPFIITKLNAQQFPVYSKVNGKLVQQDISFTTNKVITAPIIDGSLSDPEWENVSPIGALHQIYPKPFADTEFKSVIKIIYDENNLYIAAKLYDSDINNLSQNVMSKGQDIEQDDHFGLVLAPFNDKTNGYYFATNANAFKEEGLIANNNQYINNWDGIWFVEAKTFDNYWTVEMAVPFKSLAFDPDSDEWGINFVRKLKQPEQTLYWRSHGNTPRPWAPEHAGTIKGITNISQGAGIDIKLSTSAIEQRSSNNTKSSKVEPSLDITYKPSSAITASVTLNTDFSATEVDQQQINLTRFSLFTPEKRDFFLQGADIFEFGDISTNGRPFFSRKLGLSQNGEPLSINFGAKLTGQLDSTRFGILAINQQADTIKSQNTSVAVARVNHQFNDSLTIGAISTLGSANKDKDASTFGVDWQYRDKSLLSGETIEFKGWHQESNQHEENARLKDNAYQIGIYLPNEFINAKLAYTEIGNNFNPALGFVNRSAIKQIDGWLSLTSPIKPTWANNSYHTLVFDRISSFNGELISKSIFADLIDITASNQQHVRLSYQYSYENITEPFLLLGEVNIPVGVYKDHEWEIATESDHSKPLAYQLSWSKGTYLNGDMDYKSVGLAANLNKYVNIALEADHRKLTFTEQIMAINTASAKINIAFSPRLFWNNWFQYNNVSDEIGVYSRFVWQRTPMNSFNLVVNQSYIKNDEYLIDKIVNSDFTKQHQDIVLKLTYHWRF